MKLGKYWSSIFGRVHPIDREKGTQLCRGTLKSSAKFDFLQPGDLVRPDFAKSEIWIVIAVDEIGEFVTILIQT